MHRGETFLASELSRLAAVEPGDLPILSVYLDMRPEATGENPETRSGRVVLKDRLREILRTYGPRGADLESLQTDAERIEAYLDGEAPREAEGLAIFACSGRGMFEVVPAGVPFENQVTASPAPDLYQLARLLDQAETAVVAVVDTNTTRLFVTRAGFFDEVGGPDDKNTKPYRKRSMGGWSQMRYQRRIDNNREAFLKQAAEAIAELVERVEAKHLILAGDEVAIPLLQGALSPPLTELVREPVLRLGIRAEDAEVQSEAVPILAQLEQEASAQAADRLISFIRAGGLGVAGREQTQFALEQGQADTLLLSTSAQLDDETRAEMVRLATNTSARVEVVEGHEAFDRLGGVGAILRFKYDYTPSQSSSR